VPIGNATREDLATMDHSDMRGLVTAFHRFVAGLPRFRVGDHQVDAHVEGSRVPLIVFARRVADRHCRVFVRGLSPLRAGLMADQDTAGTCRATSQIKPVSSRAIATQVLL
jgi:hypothetical protein